MPPGGVPILGPQRTQLPLAAAFIVLRMGPQGPEMMTGEEFGQALLNSLTAAVRDVVREEVNVALQGAGLARRLDMSPVSESVVKDAYVS